MSEKFKTMNEIPCPQEVSTPQSFVKYKISNPGPLVGDGAKPLKLFHILDLNLQM